MVTRRWPRAYTLVELVIAIGILSFGLAAIYGQFHATRVPSQRRLYLAQAQFQAQKLLSESLASSYEDLQGWRPDSRFQKIESQPRFSYRTTTDEIGGNAIEVVVQVGWGAESDAQEPPEGQLVTVKGLHAK